MTEQEALQRAIRVYLARNGMTATDLAIALGCGQSLLSQILTGKRPLSADRLYDIADRLGCKVRDLTAEASKIRGRWV
jgi:transcriptional regulator with XRE-family HTH domain